MNFADFVDIVVQFSRYSSIPGVMFFLLFRKKWNTTSGILFYILLASFLGNFLSYTYAKYVFPNNHPIINGWHIINYLLVAWLFIKILPTKRKAVLISVGIFVVLTIVTFGWFYAFNESNTIVSTYPNLAIIILAILAYFSLLKSPTTRLKVFPVFWMITGVFIFSAVTLLIFLFQQYLIFDLQISKNGFKSIILILALINILKNFILFYTLVLIDKGYPDSAKPVPAT